MARARPRGRRGALSPSYLLRNGSIYKGFLGDSSAWRVIGIAYFGVRFMKKMLGRTEEVVATEQLAPAQFLRIEAIPMKTKAERRAAAASAPVARRRT